ncbi:hypothetical protein [Flavobacterium sp. HNIBRBA15423]|uniref:hypothetical protein n=1 Tax=Flavobacterium sp. HNIBRBA15423 TaxID=3458683 RepID=UPI004043DCFA
MSSSFVTYKKYPTSEQAKYITNLLTKHALANEYIENKASLDSNFSSTILNDFEIKIEQKDFKKADEILLNDSKEYIKTLPEDYYLFSFSNNELIEVIQKKDEWNEIDYLLAINLLKNRGVEITSEDIEKTQKDRLSQLKKPEKSARSWIIVGYIIAMLGGLLGFIIGYVLLTQMKTLPNGERVYEYIESDRKHGKNILYVGIIFFIFNVIYILFF